MITPIILSGGCGTRLWPLSRTHFPKQYWPLTSERTLLQETALRTQSNNLYNKPLIICNHEHRFLVAEQLRQIHLSPSHIILETKSHNTAPAIAIACLLQAEPEALLLVLPADHVIQNAEKFNEAVALGSQTAFQGKIVTFGILPTRAETRYGYIEKGLQIAPNIPIFEISKFLEKPNLETAQKLLTNPNYLWNSGIFLFKASTMLHELERLQPELLENCKSALEKAQNDLDFLRLDSSLIDSKSSLSIDYAVMEHTALATVIPTEMGWSDVGSWDSLFEMSPKDPEGNVMIGDIITHQVHNSYLRTDSQLLSVVGLNDIIVIAEKDAIFIANKTDAVHIKHIIDKLKLDNREELHNHNRVYRPWGYYQNIDKGEKFQVKHIVIKPGEKISAQFHQHRSEHWVIVKGTAKVTRDDQTFLLHENESVYLPMGIKHRVENPGETPLHFIEVQSGSYLGEDDIVRLEDAYGRTTVNI